MNPIIVIATIIGYFIILFSISYLSGRKADNATFFIGNRKSKWYIVAFSMISSFISGVTFVSVPGMVRTNGFSYMQMVFGFFVGQIIITFILIPLFYKIKLISIYEYLGERFGIYSYKTGASFFFISKMLGASVRLFLVCLTMQFLIFKPYHLPFLLNVIITIVIVWLYTFRGGVKSIIWTDSLKTFCLLFSIGLSIYYISVMLDLNFTNIFSSISHSEMSRIFFFDDINDKHFFFKQFFAGVFTMIAMSGLDQDMMQRALSCRNLADSQKNIITSSICQLFVNLLFLMLGVLLYLFAQKVGIQEKGDSLFPSVATSHFLPPVVGILFVIGLVSTAFSAAGSALTALTTSFTIDILNVKEGEEKKIARTRKYVHFMMAITMGLVIYVFNLCNNTSVIDAVYVLASYTYGPILGLFIFGIFIKRQIKDKYVPFVAILSPVLCYILQSHSERWFNGYKFSYELLLFNALFTFIGLYLIINRERITYEKKSVDGNNIQHRINHP